MSDPSKELTVRGHDECNGSDVFGSDICTWYVPSPLGSSLDLDLTLPSPSRPYLMFGIEEAVKCAQRGGAGVVVYFRKEGRSLGEVTKYLVYNARKRSGDKASEYFERTEKIAGVKGKSQYAFEPSED